MYSSGFSISRKHCTVHYVKADGSNKCPAADLRNSRQRVCVCFAPSVVKHIKALNGSHRTRLPRLACSTDGALTIGSEEPAPQNAVPWDWKKILQVMSLWLLSHMLLGQLLIPLGLAIAGLDRESLSLRGHALLHVILDAAQLSATLAILLGCLRRYGSLTRLLPLRWGGWWPLRVLVACAAFPVIDWMSAQEMAWFPVEGDVLTDQLQQSLTLGDPFTHAAYFSVVSVCTPLWEELLFRGFLLLSLRKYMPAPAATLISSFLFAACHFRLTSLLHLMSLGLVFSVVFLASNNLLPAIVLHSLWNFHVYHRLFQGV